jgi:hypothetical protein
MCLKLSRRKRSFLCEEQYHIAHLGPNTITLLKRPLRRTLVQLLLKQHVPFSCAGAILINDPAMLLNYAPGYLGRKPAISHPLIVSCYIVFQFVVFFYNEQRPENKTTSRSL